MWIVCLKKSGRLLIEKVCRVVLLKRSLRWLIRRILHSARLPGWFDRILAKLSGVIPIDDIESFEASERVRGRKMHVATRPIDHWAVAATYWRGFGFIDAETIAVFCERASIADTILDIGANWGYYTLLAGAINPSAQIIAFEPHPFWFEQLLNNIKVNEFKNVRVENLAVSDSSGNSTFYLGGSPGVSSLVKEYNQDENPTEITVNTISLAEYAREQKFCKRRRIDLIKLDVEIYESAVLAGAKSILRRFKPDIICEVLPDETHTIDIRIANREAIQEILSELMYTAYWISNKGLVREDVIQGHYPFPNYLFTARLVSEL